MAENTPRGRFPVPELLQRIFHTRVRTLEDTIFHTAVRCRCKQRSCLCCGRDQATSILLRTTDPSNYRLLLTRCYAVIDENAPPPPPFNCHSRWPQIEIVRRTIETIIYEQPSSSNLICVGYDKVSRRSAVVDKLACSAWTLLLQRVGDALMMYLLKYTSLFLFLPGEQNHQITGIPMSDLCYKLLSRVSDSETPHQLPSDNGLKKKRKRSGGAKPISVKKLCAVSVGSEPSSNFISSVEEFSCVTTENSLKNEGIPNPCNASIRKHKRQHRKQRQRKLRKLAIEETYSLNMSIGSCSTSDNLTRRLQDGFTAGSSQSTETNIPDLLCNSEFQNLRKISQNAEIDRRTTFYRLESSKKVLPINHILYTLKPDDSGARVLFKNIFQTLGSDVNTLPGPCFRSEGTFLTKSPCLYHSFLDLLKKLIRNTRNCQHLRLLDKHCNSSLTSSYAETGVGPALEGNDSGTNLPICRIDAGVVDGNTCHADNNENSNIISEATTETSQPINSYCQKKQVVSFIWAICRKIVPSALLGTHSNWRILRKNISKFIELRRFEKFSLKECMHKLKLSQFPLLSHKPWELGVTDIIRHEIFECWIFWFFSYLVSPLVEANFYVTESEHEMQEILYYKKSTWGKLKDAEKCLINQTYRQLNHLSALRIFKKRPFGFSKIRLLPKKNGFRVLQNLSAPSRICVKPPLSRIHSYQKPLEKALWKPQNDGYIFYRSVNNALCDVLAVVKGLQKKEPENLGSSVFDYNDIYRKLVPFLLLLKNGSTTMPGAFVVVSDVEKAFDSINHEKLLTVMKDVIHDDAYTIDKFIQVIQTKSSFKVHHHLTLGQQNIIAESAKIRLRNPNGILVKQALGRMITNGEFHMILKEHITRNVLRFDNSFYLQDVGIPQGGVLSTLLCSYYYAHMEKKIVFPFLLKAFQNIDTHGPSASGSSEGSLVDTSKNILLRFVDDFLFISTSKQQASMFFTRLDRGVRDYHCYTNKCKYGLNFEMADKQIDQSNRLFCGKDGVSFLRWSGLLLNCCTLEIQADYTRYENTHLSSSLTISRQGKVGEHLKKKLRDYLLPKCHPIFYDSNINSAGVVRLNIYQSFLLCAMKFICHISNLSPLPKFSPKFYFKAIIASLRYMDILIKRKMNSVEDGISFRPKYDVTKEEVLWLGLYAYSRAFKRKQSQHKNLLCMLMSKLKAYGEVSEMSSELKYAIDDAHSSVLWKLKY